MTRASLGCIAIGCALFAGAATPQERAQPVTHVVTIEGMQYKPSSLTVRAGERVTWVNKDLFPHTITATTKSFDSGEVAASASWTYVSRVRGEYPYICTYHPAMKGELIVR